MDEAKKNLLKAERAVDAITDALNALNFYLSDANKIDLVKIRKEFLEDKDWFNNEN